MKAEQFEKLVTLPYGSRLYGTFTAQSDHDWKIIYLPPIEELLVGGDKVLKNKFFGTSSDEVKNTSEDTDTEYIALQTLARDFVTGQAYAIEVVFGILNSASIPGAVIHDPSIRFFFDDLVQFFLNDNMRGMVGYAYSQAATYGMKGNRLTFLRELRDGVQEFVDFGYGKCTIHDMVSDNIEFRKFVANLEDQYPEDWFSAKAIHIDTTKNKYHSFVCFKKTYLGTNTLEHVLPIFTKTVEAYGKRSSAAADAEGHDWKALHHAVRVTVQALNLMEDGWITFPLYKSQTDYLKQIKAGLVPFDEVTKMLVDNVDALEEGRKDTVLQPFSEGLLKDFEYWLKQQMLDLYNIQGVHV